MRCLWRSLDDLATQKVVVVMSNIGSYYPECSKVLHYLMNLVNSHNGPAMMTASQRLSPLFVIFTEIIIVINFIISRSCCCYLCVHALWYVHVEYIILHIICNITQSICNDSIQITSLIFTLYCIATSTQHINVFIMILICLLRIIYY